MIYLCSYKGEIFGASARVGGPGHSGHWPDIPTFHQRHLRKTQTKVLINMEGKQGTNALLVGLNINYVFLLPKDVFGLSF